MSCSRTMGNKCLVRMKDSSINVHTNNEKNRRFLHSTLGTRRRFLEKSVAANPWEQHRFASAPSLVFFLFFFSVLLLFALQHVFDRLVSASIHLGTNLFQHFIHQGAVFGLLGNYQFAEQINPHSLAKHNTTVTCNLLASQGFSNQWNENQ